jgi:hypothetical protein
LNDSASVAVSAVDGGREAFHVSAVSAVGTSSVLHPAARSSTAKGMRNLPKGLLESMRASDDMAVQLKAAVIHYVRCEEVREYSTDFIHGLLTRK